MYAAGVAGGIWKTTNGGAKWTALDDMLPNLAVCSLAMDPKNSKILIAGTGEGYFNGDGVRGAGMFKTTDEGLHWALLPSTQNSDFYYVNDIIISPNDSQRFYAATGTGVWRSTDGGSIWSRVLPTKVYGGCLDLAIRTDQSTDYLFASCGTFQQATIYRNTDAGRAGSWSSVFTDPDMGRTSLAIAPSNQAVIYALSASNADDDYQYGLLAVFRSTSSGDSGSWKTMVRNTDKTRLNTVLLTNPVYAFYKECGWGSEEYYYNQGWYDNVIAVDPKDPNRVWAGGIDLFRSDDGGANWGLASYWWLDPDRRYNHADHHAIVFHPGYKGASNKVMFIGNDGGVFKTLNAHAATAKGTAAPCAAHGGFAWINLNNNYGVTQFYHGTAYPGRGTYFGGT